MQNVVSIFKMEKLYQFRSTHPFFLSNFPLRLVARLRPRLLLCNGPGFTGNVRSRLLRGPAVPNRMGLGLSDCLCGVLLSRTNAVADGQAAVSDRSCRSPSFSI